MIALGIAALALLAQDVPLSAPGTAASTPTGTPASDDPEQQDIYVYGRGDSAVIVDIERIAVSCLACRRALDELRDDGGSARRRAPPNRLNSTSQGLGDARTYEQDFTGEGPLGAAPSASIRTHGGIGGASAIGSMQRRAWAARRRQQQRDSAAYRGVGSAYLQNLMRYLAPIIERQRTARQVASVYRPDQAPRGRDFPDITDDVLRELDREHPAVDLLAVAVQEGAGD